MSSIFIYSELCKLNFSQSYVATIRCMVLSAIIMDPFCFISSKLFSFPVSQHKINFWTSQTGTGELFVSYMKVIQPKPDSRLKWHVRILHISATCCFICYWICKTSMTKEFLLDIVTAIKPKWIFNNKYLYFVLA